MVEDIRLRPEDITTITIPITLDNLPVGPRWEADGSRWECLPDPMDQKGWRWWPQNLKALGKDGPEGEMTDFVQPICIQEMPERYTAQGMQLRENAKGG